MEMHHRATKTRSHLMWRRWMPQGLTTHHHRQARTRRSNKMRRKDGLTFESFEAGYKPGMTSNNDRMNYLYISHLPVAYKENVSRE